MSWEEMEITNLGPNTWTHLDNQHSYTQLLLKELVILPCPIAATNTVGGETALKLCYMSNKSSLVFTLIRPYPSVLKKLVELGKMRGPN